MFYQINWYGNPQNLQKPHGVGIAKTDGSFTYNNPTSQITFNESSLVRSSVIQPPKLIVPEQIGIVLCFNGQK